jgi:hypothetical protein
VKAPRVTDLADGSRFGRLTVLGCTDAPTGRTGKYYECRCECGRLVVVAGMALRATRGTRSCGCLRHDRSVEVNTTHGGTLGGRRSPEFSVWMNMIQRCTNPRHKNFHRYGGRGITVCDRWLNSFEAFFSDMGSRPAGTSIDRIDSNGNYEPGNCRWVTQREQVLNTCRARWYVYRGRSYRMHDLVKLSGLTVEQLKGRLKRGWSVEAAMETPTRGRKPRTDRLGSILKVMVW